MAEANKALVTRSLGNKVRVMVDGTFFDLAGVDGTVNLFGSKRPDKSGPVRSIEDYYFDFSFATQAERDTFLTALQTALTAAKTKLNWVDPA